jgi:hypothetical protein
MIYTREDLYLRGYVAIDFGTEKMLQASQPKDAALRQNQARSEGQLPKAQFPLATAYVPVSSCPENHQYRT